MSFGMIIKKLRRERDLTQEELADTFSISSQAISRWETDAAMPDISLLPTLCNYFGVSADMLLGIDIRNKREKINKLCAEAQKYSFCGYYEEARKILEAGMSDYPDSCEIMNDLMYISFWQHNENKEKIEFCNEAIRLGELILAKSTVDGLRQSAIQVLCYCYRDSGCIDEAVKLADNMPYIANSKEILLSSIYAGDKGYQVKQKEMFSLLHFLSFDFNDLLQAKNDLGKCIYNDDERAILREKQIKLLNLFFEDANFGFYNTLLWNTHMSQASYFLVKMGDTQKALENISVAAEYAIRFVKSVVDDKYTSIVFKGITRGVWCGSDTDNDAERLLKILDDHTFDGIRNYTKFVEIKTELSNYAGKWQVK